MPSNRNLLIIIAGGMRTDVCSHIGDWPINTPHLDAVARHGVSAAAVCASTADRPALLSVFSGLSPRQHGVVDDDTPSAGVAGWVKSLAEAGYHTAGVGRVGLVAAHLRESCVVAEVDSFDPGACAYLSRMDKRGMIDRVLGQRRQRARSGPMEWATASTLMSGDDVDGFIAQQARLMIERAPKDRPWAILVAFTGPGNDLPAPMQYLAPIDPKPLADRFVPVDLLTLDRFGQTKHPRALLQRLRPAQVAEMRRHYLARVLMIDHYVGVLRDMVDRLGHAPRTWITFTSDHGYLLGERSMVGARCFLNAVVYAPAWLMPPDGADFDRELVSQRLISTADWAATVCEAAGVDPPRGCLGRSMLAALRGQEIGSDSAICEFADRLMLETMQHRAVFNVDSRQMLTLFDLVRDPGESRDLTLDPVASNLGDMLRWHLAQALLPIRPVAAA